MEWVFYLLLVLGVVALVGHGIWVFLAFIVRTLFFEPQPSQRPPAPLAACPACGRLMQGGQPRCEHCGHQRRDLRAAELADLDAVQRQLQRWRERGELKPRFVERLLARVQIYRRQLLAPRGAATPAEQSSESPVKEREHAATVLARQRLAASSPVEAPIEAILVDAPPAKPFAALAAAAAKSQIVPPPAEPAPPLAPRPADPPAPRPPLPPRPPRRSFAEMLATFMEQRNIRWGELVGGLLIVCSSIALVISLWETLRTIPYFQFFIFVGVSAAVFGVGLYTEHRWKLESTSRGILIIATLLVPLNFVAMAGTARAGWDLVAVSMELVSLAIFTWLVARAAEVLTPAWRWPSTLAVVGSSGVLLLVPHHPQPAALVALAAIAVACHGLATGRALFSLRWAKPELRSVAEPGEAPSPEMREPRRISVGVERANELFVLLGASSFALVVALGLMVVRSEDRAGAMSWLSPLVALAALPICGAGLAVARGLKDEEHAAGWQMAGTAVGLVGVVGMLAANALAWPLPAAMIAVGLLNFAALSAIGWRYRLPLAHAAAIASFAIVYLVGFHFALGHFVDVPRNLLGQQMIELALTAQTGTSLCGLFFILAVVSEILFRRGRPIDAAYYAAGSAAAAIVSLSIVFARTYLAGGSAEWQFAGVCAAYGVASLVLNLRWRRPLLSYLGSGLIAAALAEAGFLHPVVDLACPWMAVCLGHATIAMALGFAFGRLAGAARDAEPVFVEPLLFSATISSVASLAALLKIDQQPPWALAMHLGWLAALWLVLAVRRRSADWFAAFQAALAASVVAAITAWLYEQPWVDHQARALADPRSLQVYGIGLSLLCAGWSAARIALRRQTVAALFFNDESVPVDRWTYRLLAIGGLALAAWGVAPGVLAQLSSVGIGVVAAGSGAAVVFGPFAWWLVAAQGFALVVALWDRWRGGEVACGVLLIVASAVLAAGPFASSAATASALRWSLGGAFAIASALVWLRAPLARALQKLGCRCETAGRGSSIAQGLLLSLSAAPVLIVTAAVVAMRIYGLSPAGPAPGSWFDGLGFNLSYLVPLGIVSATLLGYALREVSPGYAFAAGAVTNAAVGGGYALSVQQFGAVECATLLQLCTITAAAWGAGWLASRRKILAIGGCEESATARPLLRVQLGLATLGNLLLIVPALGLLAVFSPGSFMGARSWITAAGSPLGWGALISTIAAASLAGWQWRRRWRPEVVGLAGMAMLGLGACTIAWTGAGDVWAYRALMLGWALYALSIVAATWWITNLYATASNSPSMSQSLVRSAALWVRLAGLLALALGLKTAIFDPDEQLWAAAAIALAGGACAAMAVWRRREGWAFIAGLGVNLAASIVVWHWQFADQFRFADAWLLLVQANLIASAAVALVWIAVHKRMYGDRLPSISSGPLLGVQMVMLLLGNLLAVGVPLVELVTEPGQVASSLVQAGGRGGWLAWLLGGAAVALHCHQISRRELPHFIAALLLGAGVLAAGTATAWRPEPWMGYHVLVIAWAASGFALLAAAWMLGPKLAWLKSLATPATAIASTTTIGSLLVALAVRGAWDDSQRPYWSVAATLSASLMAAIVAIGFRKPDHKYASVGLVNLAIALVAIAAKRSLTMDFWSYHLIAIGAQGVAWSLLGRWIDRRQPAEDRGELPPLEHAAALLGTLLLSLTVVYNVLRAAGLIPASLAAIVPFDFAADPTVSRLAGPLAWTAWIATAAAMAVLLWDARARFTLPGMYAIGLAGVGLAVERLAASPLQLVQWLTPALAGYVLFAAGLERFSGRRNFAPTALSPSSDAVRRASAWFSPTQFAASMLAAALSLWLVLDSSWPFDRLPGGIAAALLLAAAVVAARQPERSWAAAWRSAALCFAVLAGAEFGWTWLEGTGAIFWLHRQVVLATALFLAVLAGQFGLPKLMPRSSDWIASARKASTAFSGLLLLLLAAVLAQEWDVHEPGVGVPMNLAAKLAVAVMLAGMTMLLLAYAVRADLDPLGLSLRGRTIYVYAAELLALLVVVHVRTAMPQLLPIGLLDKYWTLIVMIVAFAGAGLSELFQRRRLSVLSEPLSRTALVAPLVPAFGHWLVPALYIDAEAVLFLVAAFYGLQATLKRSFALACLAVVSGNAALWVLWGRLRLDFFHHPQLWLIPVALAVLAAEHLHRNRLTPQQAGATRYFALAVIYVSSTVDVFMSHHGRDLSLTLVMVLLGLSIAGVLAGILLQVRSFLYLGVTFLLVDLSIMIYHAAWDRGHAWVFWLSGIAVGAAIIALFAVFEKRRNDLRLALDRFKEWR